MGTTTSTLTHLLFRGIEQKDKTRNMRLLGGLSMFTTSTKKNQHTQPIKDHMMEYGRQFLFCI